eukprot:3838239-Rhodomonas_salina.1
MPCNMQIKVANGQSILQPMKGKLHLVVHDKNMEQVNIDGEVYYSRELSHTLISARRLVNQGYSIALSSGNNRIVTPHGKIVPLEFDGTHWTLRSLAVITPRGKKLGDNKIEASLTTTRPSKPVAAPVPPAPPHVPDQTQSSLPTTAQQPKPTAQSADIESVPTKAHDLGTDKLVQEDSVTMSDLIKDTINKIEGDQRTSRITTGFREIMHKRLNHTNDDDIVRLTQMAKDREIPKLTFQKKHHRCDDCLA